MPLPNRRSSQLRAALLFAILPLLPLLAACSTEGEAAGAGRWESVTEKVGDTTVVRTVSGSVWGGEAQLIKELEIGVLDGDPALMFGQINALAVGPDGAIYAVDRQVPEVRVFSPDGKHRATFGRPGEGPGELKQPDGGFAVLADGRVLVRDPGNARIQLYASDGKALGQWPHRGGFFTSNPLWVTRDGHVYTQILVDPEADVREWRMGLVHLAPDGTPMDTLEIPKTSFVAPVLEARVEGSSSRSSVPFSPGESWALHPDGFFVHALSTNYRISLLRPDAPLRIERHTEPVPVTAGEKEEDTRRATVNMRRTDPNWRWNGPAVPDTKPPFRSVQVGKDGRIWVQVSQPGVEGEDPNYDPTDPNAVADRWKEPLAFDVFETDGRYLGRVHGPMGLGQFVFDGDNVWAVSRDELGVQRIVRFRIARGERP